MRNMPFTLELLQAWLKVYLALYLHPSFGVALLHWIIEDIVHAIYLFKPMALE